MSPRPDGSDVIVIGAGIVGASATFFLRRRGRSVTLLESGLAGQQASGVNFGNVRRQGRPLFQLPLANRANPIWRSLPELLGEDVEYLEAGHLRVCYRDRPDVADGFADYAREAAPLGLDLEVLGEQSLRQRFPFLGPEVIAGSFSARDGHANPRLAAPAFARAAARAGARVLENAPVAAVQKAGEDFEVTLEDGRAFRAPVVLVTAGAWANAFCEAFGEPVPLTTKGPTMCVTEPVRYAIAPSIGIATPLEVESVYFRQIPRGNVIIGGSTRQDVFPDIRRAYVDPENTLTQLGQIQRLAPALGKLNIIRVWTGIESYLPDGLPVIGPSARASGLFYAFGFCGSGFQTGPAVGDVMAELVDTGATETPISHYRIDRFAAA
jgi:sarcosine oxidase subunit beta